MNALPCEVTAGDGQVCVLGSGEALKFTCNGSWDDFQEPFIDDTEISDEYYSAVSGSTVLTLTSGFLESLSPGAHTLQFLYNTADNRDFRSNKATFYIAKSSTVPRTGSASAPLLWLAVAAVSGCAFLAFRKKRGAC